MSTGLFSKKIERQTCLNSNKAMVDVYLMFTWFDSKIHKQLEP